MSGPGGGGALLERACHADADPADVGGLELGATKKSEQLWNTLKS